MNEYAEQPYPRPQKKSYKKPIVLGLMTLGMVGIVWGLLSAYGVISATTSVNQSVVITDPIPPIYTNGAVAGESVDELLQIRNNRPSSGVNVNLNAVENSIPVGAIWGSDIVITFYNGWTGTACSGSVIVNPVLIPAASTVDFCTRATFDVAAVAGNYSYNVSVTP